ncbi:potassium channel family protein [Methanobrevibacter sp. TMH8]|uniref:potassium channel family protein n=1 Tax=Methanobrevibacter sp. TMH8 TaxID=2848611 RepID=UPI001CCECE5F|nr:potassium channel family protein [Methanobrevibacter sp. TMH8]MBZ9570474.1 potassium channel family protein [Methanobrevibacter sp. TMH8]
MPSIKDILIEMKNLSELMVDLAYSAVLFNSKDAAKEVLKLENKVNSSNYEIKKQSLVAARSVEDAEKLTALLEIAEAAESIANAAKDLADIVIKGIKPHPVFKMVMEEAEELIVSVSVQNDSELCDKSLGELVLANRTGMIVIAIRRDENWIYGPDKNTVIRADDTLIAKGTEVGSELLKKLANNEIDVDDIVDIVDEESLSQIDDS